MIDRFRPGLRAESEKTATETPKKVRGRPFQPGNTGRPPGSKNRTTRLLEQLMTTEGEKVGRKVIELAVAGNVKCLQLCLDRLLPRRSGRPVDVSLPPINGMHDVVASLSAITTAVNNGGVTAEEAGHLVQLLKSYAEILETHDLAVRLETLESQIQKKSP